MKRSLSTMLDTLLAQMALAYACVRGSWISKTHSRPPFENPQPEVGGT
jgi:hypothetical protein